MKFSARQDIDAPAAFVFATFADFDAWERAAMRRGVEVLRLGASGAETHAVGAAWQVKFQFRAKKRTVDLVLQELSPPHRLEFSAQSPAMQATLTVEIAQMSALRTRIHVVSDVTPRTLTAKLFIQSMRLARAKADRKYALRIAEVAADITARYQADGQTA
jgi:uncharacterized protein YndB with AHSA1/START domain